MRRLLVSALIVSLSLSFAFGCGGSSNAEGTTSAEVAEPAGDATSGATAALVPWAEATIGDRTTCPVTNEEFVVTADSAKVEHEGHTYYFCCAGCIGRFQANPAQYLGGS
jgi:YHS domain-containing protein